MKEWFLMLITCFVLLMSPSQPVTTDIQHLKQLLFSQDQYSNAKQRSEKLYNLTSEKVIWSSNENVKLAKRSISNAVIESANCEHIELIDCEEYESKEMTCMVTATGMPCCRCVGRLKKRRSWKLW
uniref:Uncharacterized protein n=1 Tax=Ditylenchus dipsaci TaxID=166011 RepID=A0A915DCB4_9BILA